jgi:hypothetical protein
MASELGRDPQPGLALLRLATGKVEAAAASIRRAYHEAGDPISRARLAAGYVEITLASGDVAAARSAAEELGIVAATLGQPLPNALHMQVLGAVLLAEDQPETALSALRRALARWRELDAAYEAARTRADRSRMPSRGRRRRCRDGTRRRHPSLRSAQRVP